MVDFLNMDFSGINFLGAASGMMDTVKMVFMLLVVVLLAWGCMYLLSFKHRVRIRRETASGHVVIDTKAREFSTREGAKKWRFLKMSLIRASHFAPPVDHLELTDKGKFSAEADMTMDGVLNWRKRSGVPDLQDSFTGEERTLQVMENRRAEEYRRTGTLSKLLELAPMIFTVIILVLLFAFWGDITNASIKSLDKAVALEAQATEAVKSLDASVQRQNLILEKVYGVKIPGLNGSVDTKGQVLPDIPN